MISNSIYIYRIFLYFNEYVSFLSLSKDKSNILSLNIRLSIFLKGIDKILYLYWNYLQIANIKKKLKINSKK